MAPPSKTTVSDERMAQTATATATATAASSPEYDDNREYRDFGMMTESDAAAGVEGSGDGAALTRTAAGKGPSSSLSRSAPPSSPLPPKGDRNFPKRLHYMLTEAEKDRLDHIISWRPHGRCFIVHRPKEFAEFMLPLWFRQTKFASFQRQLNLYGFKRFSRGLDKGAYYHEHFLRGMDFLCDRIQRFKVKGTLIRRPSSPENEPDFYSDKYVKLPPSPVNKNAIRTRNGAVVVGGGAEVARPYAAKALPRGVTEALVRTAPSPGAVVPVTSQDQIALSILIARRREHELMLQVSKVMIQQRLALLGGINNNDTIVDDYTAAATRGRNASLNSKIIASGISGAVPSPLLLPGNNDTSNKESYRVLLDGPSL